jgi:hypothetical protein
VDAGDVEFFGYDLSSIQEVGNIPHFS